MKPYYADAAVTLYHADFRDVLASVTVDADLVLADPPYGETALAWDRWPAGWPSEAMKALYPTRGSLWCFGSMRMFLAHTDEFSDAGWKLAQDIVWEKHNGFSFHADRFKRVHENAVHFYPADRAWADVHKSPPRIAGESRSTPIRSRGPTPHTGTIGSATVYEYGETRIARSVIRANSCHGYAENETQKPEAIVRPLVEYSCPPAGVVFSPFAGSGTDLVVAKSAGRRAVGCELREQQCEVAARRLSQGVLALAVGGAA